MGDLFHFVLTTTVILDMCACFADYKTVFQSTCALKAHAPSEHGLVPMTPLTEEETGGQRGKEGSGTEQKLGPELPSCAASESDNSDEPRWKDRIDPKYPQAEASLRWVELRLIGPSGRHYHGEGWSRGSSPTSPPTCSCTTKESVHRVTHASPLQSSVLDAPHSPAIQS